MAVDGLSIIPHIPGDRHVSWLPHVPGMNVVGLLDPEDLSYIVEGVENDEDMWDFCRLTGTWHSYVMFERESGAPMAFCVIETVGRMVLFHGGRVPDYSNTMLVYRGTLVMLKTLLDIGYDVRTTPAHEKSRRFMSAMGFRPDKTEEGLLSMRLTGADLARSLAGKRVLSAAATDNRRSLTELLRLKHTLSSVNNRITVLATLGFVDHLLARVIIGARQADDMKAAIRSQHANANGYDIRHLEGTPVIAEIKCNIPVNGDEFGAAQRGGIEKDIKGLAKGKTRETPADAFKFMVILNTDGVFASIDTGKAIDRLIPALRNTGSDVRPLPDDNSLLEKNIIYVVNLKL